MIKANIHVESRLQSGPCKPSYMQGKLIWKQRRGVLEKVALQTKIKKMKQICRESLSWKFPKAQERWEGQAQVPAGHFLYVCSLL